MTEAAALRLSAMPTTESALRNAFAGGMLEERAYCDLKREIGDTPSARLELARDLASFAIDGGTLVVGIDEKPADDNHFRPFALNQQVERIEQVALSRIDPPLVVRCVAVPTDADAAVGYLLVHVPMSPLAPHQVDGRYWARGDKTKRQLSDPEVERYIRRREVWARGAAELLDGWIAEDPYAADQHFPHLFVVARPVAGDSELAAKLVAVQHWIANLQGLISAVQTDVEHRDARERTARDLSSSLPANGTPQKLANGTRVSTTAPGSTHEQYTVTLDVLDDGAVRLFVGCVGVADNFNGVAFTRVWTEFICSSVRDVVVLTKHLCRATGFRGSWDFGVGLTGMLGAHPAPTTAGPQVMSPLGSAYTEGSYRNTTRATSEECSLSPGTVVNRLTSRLLSGLGAFGHAMPLRSAPESALAGQ